MAEVTIQPNSKLRAAAILVAVFALGGVTGGAITRWQLNEELRGTMKLPPYEARARLRLHAMRRHLDLTDEQASKIEQILVEAYRVRDDIDAPCQPAFDEHRKRVRQQIDEVLTPEQRRQQNEMRARWDKDRGRSK